MFTESMIQTYTQAETFRQGLGIPRGARSSAVFWRRGSIIGITDSSIRLQVRLWCCG